MQRLKVALLQILPTGTQAGNLARGVAFCEQAKALGADIALFPEMWSTGYRIPEDPKARRACAVSSDSGFLRTFSDLTATLQMAIGVTYLKSHDPLPQNALCLFDRFGKRQLSYAKVHTCDFGEERMLDAGDDFYVCTLDTAAGLVKIGAMICFDREFPESARILMLKGAEVILVPNACPMEINRLSQLRARAYENMLGIATANYPAGQPDCNGHSSAFDGVAYAPGASSSRDTLLLEAGEAEGVYIADFPIDDMRAYRGSEVHGNAYRLPKKYGLLLSEQINEPFVRGDRRD